MLNAFPLQQWFLERAVMLLYTRIACLVGDIDFPNSLRQDPYVYFLYVFLVSVLCQVSSWLLFWC
jgi:hypothetical protein